MYGNSIIKCLFLNQCIKVVVGKGSGLIKLKKTNPASVAGDSKQEPFFCICWNTGVVTGPNSHKSQNWGSHGAVPAKGPGMGEEWGHAFWGLLR